jgi:hypothetical protein
VNTSDYLKKNMDVAYISSWTVFSQSIKKKCLEPMLHLKIKLIFKIYSIEILLDFQVVEGIPHQWWCVSCSLVPCSGLLRLTLSLLCYPQVLDWSLSDRRWGIWVGKDFLWLGCDLFFVWKEICCSKMFYIYKTKNTLFLIAKFVWKS